MRASTARNVRVLENVFGDISADNLIIAGDVKIEYNTTLNANVQIAENSTLRKSSVSSTNYIFTINGTLLNDGTI
jgi:hypothetical protein